MNVPRRAFLAGTAAAVLSAGRTASRVSVAAAPTESGSVQWHDVRDWGIEGRGFDGTDAWFDRLPGRARGVVRDAVWNLSRQSAGMMVRFRTDATDIHADYRLTSSRLAMPHMPATGVSGLDLYAADEGGRMRWVSVVRPTAQDMRVRLVDGLQPGLREYAVYLPLYNGVVHLHIGVPAGARFEPIAPRTQGLLVFYGTSITQGACASRPGMPHPAILGRRLNRPVINLGFSGNGRMESSVGQFLAELDAAVFVLDCLPNMEADAVRERTEPMVHQLRRAHPAVPIVLVEDRTYSNAWIRPSARRRHDTSRAELRAAFMRLQESGVKRLWYIAGDRLLAGDDTTDGSHPSDLGFVRHADVFEPVLKEALAAAEA